LLIRGSWYPDGLVLFFVEEEVLFTWIVRPNILDRLIELTFILHLLEVLDDLYGSARALCIVDKFVAASGPGGIFEFGCKF